MVSLQHIDIAKIIYHKSQTDASKIYTYYKQYQIVIVFIAFARASILLMNCLANPKKHTQFSLRMTGVGM